MKNGIVWSQNGIVYVKNGIVLSQNGIVLSHNAVKDVKYRPKGEARPKGDARPWCCHIFSRPYMLANIWDVKSGAKRQE